MIHNSPVAVIVNQPVVDHTGSSPIVYSDDSEPEELADTSGEETDEDSSGSGSTNPVVRTSNLTCPFPSPFFQAYSGAEAFCSRLLQKYSRHTRTYG
jgi:hypothetical protein